MLKNILLKLLKPNHQPEMIVAKAGADNPFARPRGAEFADDLIQRYWINNTAVNDHHTAKMINSFAEKMMADCRKILTSPDPVKANRQKLAESVLSCAKLQVLVISPEPAPDGTGLRGHLGITGELKARIPDIIKVDKEFETFPNNLDFDKAWHQIQYAYRRSWAYMNVFEGLRHEFDDIHPEQEQDWFRPFFASQCAYSESNYRAELGMPNVLHKGNDSGALSGTMYGNFLNIVLGGDKYPDQTWEKQYPDLENPKAVWG
jgi:hypothetical protein